MVFTYMIIAMLGMVKLIFGILPNAPATPPEVVSAGGWIVTEISSVMSVLTLIFSPVLVAATVVVIIAMFTWEHIYASAMWIVRKIPMINMK
jgi:hypothetical protein